MNKTFAEKVIEFNQHLIYTGKLPPDYRVINPFQELPETDSVMQQFYRKYYDDQQRRQFIIGINPSRHGAGITGVPFTDTKRLASACGITMHSAHTHEISSVFMYDLIKEYGGTKQFYNRFYINSPFPLAIIRRNAANQWINANYYDDTLLFELVKNFMIQTLKKHIDLGLDTSEVYVLGIKNAKYIHKLNQQEKLFERIHALEHPRFIQQYKFHQRQDYITKFLNIFD